MKRIAQGMTALAVLLAAAGARAQTTCTIDNTSSDPVPATVVNPTWQPVPTTSADRPQPFHASVVFHPGAFNMVQVAVPTGMRLVIEHVSFYAGGFNQIPVPTVTVADASGAFGSFQARHYLPATWAGVTPGTTGSTYIASQELHLILDQGSYLLFVSDLGPGNLNLLEQADVSGYLLAPVSQPAAPPPTF